MPLSFSAAEKSVTVQTKENKKHTAWWDIINISICRPVASVKARAMLRSANDVELSQPLTKEKCYGSRSFCIATPTVWDNLPKHLRTHDTSHEQFIWELKTFLFAHDYLLQVPSSVFI